MNKKSISKAIVAFIALISAFFVFAPSPILSTSATSAETGTVIEPVTVESEQTEHYYFNIAPPSIVAEIQDNNTTASLSSESQFTATQKHSNTCVFSTLTRFALRGGECLNHRLSGEVTL